MRVVTRHAYLQLLFQQFVESVFKHSKVGEVIRDPGSAEVELQE